MAYVGRNNKMGITIRKAEEEDFLAIFSLIKEFAAFQKTPEKVTISLKEMIAEKHLFQCFVAENEAKEIIGFISYFFTYYSWVGKSLYIDDLYVSTAYRGQKIGTDLMKRIFEIAKEASCKKVRWQVSNWNKPAIDFYKQMGAVVDDVEINCDLMLEMGDRSQETGV